MPAIVAERRANSHVSQGLDAPAETVKGGEVVGQRNVCRWVKRPEAVAGGWGRAVLSVNGTEYAASSFHADDEDSGHSWQVVDLRKADGTHYRLTFGPDGDFCDCPQATYRGCRCKHTSSVRAALRWLEERERAEWELAQAEAAVYAAVEAAGDPFAG